MTGNSLLSEFAGLVTVFYVVWSLMTIVRLRRQLVVKAIVNDLLTRVVMEQDAKITQVEARAEALGKQVTGE